jgi:hypothetical protein
MTVKKKPVKGGKMKGAGRPKGSVNKITGEKILLEISLQFGKPFEQLLAEGYHASIIAGDFTARIAYEKMILSKVVADKHELDVHSMGQSLVNNFKFTQRELPDFETIPALKIIDAKSK